MIALVTGAAGFIGSHLVDELLRKGDEVIGVDNLSNGTMKNIQHLVDHPHFDFYEIDANDVDDIADLMNDKPLSPDGDIDIVYHLAANSNVQKSRDDPSIDLKNTFMTTYNVLEAMRQTNVKNIVFSSTSAVYSSTVPARRSENDELLPISLYGAAKMASEGFISAYVENYRMNSWIMRFPNVVGERSTHGILFDFYNKLMKDPTKLEILGNGEQKKPYIYVKDLVSAMMYITSHDEGGHSIYNIGPKDDGILVKRIAGIVSEEMGLKPEFIFTSKYPYGWKGDVSQFYYNVEKLERLGWKCLRNSEQAIRYSIRMILEEKNYIPHK